MMDNQDRPDEPLPMRRMQVPPASHAYDGAGDGYAYGMPPDPSGGGKKVSLGLVWRAFRRYWWQAALVWLFGSAGLVALAYTKIKPSYDATATIRVEHGGGGIVAPVGANQIDFDQYMLTQVRIITTPTIIGTALLANPELSTLPMLKDSSDPERELARNIRAAVIKGTSLIEVQMSSQNKGEAATLVNAVVKAFIDNALLTHDDSNKKLIQQLKTERDEKKKELDNQRTIISDLQKRLGANDIAVLKDRNSTTTEQYRQLQSRLTEVEIRLIAEKSHLERCKNDRVAPPTAIDPEQLMAAVTVEFYNHPKVEEIQREIDKQTRLKEEAKRISQSPSDPSVRLRQSNIEIAKAKKNELWGQLQPQIAKRLSTTPTDAELENEIRQAENSVHATATEEEILRKKLESLRVENKKDDAEAMKLEFARIDLQNTQNFLDIINRNLYDKEFSAKSPIAQISAEHMAKASDLADANRRTQAMIASPLLMGALVLGLLCLLELRGARVSDPDELVSRIKLQVIGVVPPLPQVRHMAHASLENGHANGDGHGHNGNGDGHGNGHGAILSASEFRARRQLDEFVQSLDHLRVALCARRDPWGRDRHCVLITSACGSEGKTTLAAQLAERCVNAGLMTLLIDADLRNPTLSRMLDAEQSPGLINVLRGEVMAEDVVTVIGDAGGFHLLPAGTPRMDPSRLLQGDRLGSLIAQARESFDMIIVDAPPVLPVPDALTIGRWVDGAVLAVRHDTSRFPLVEKAHRRLVHVGVHVIGAVVNGVKSMESAYGYGGYYAYGSAPNTSSPTNGSASASSKSSLLDD